MALRIGPAATQVAPIEEPMMEDPMPEQSEVMSEPMMMGEEEMGEPNAMELGKVAPIIAVYRTPDMGPFMCGNCAYFRGDSCIIVDGSIEPEGICNMFTAAESEEAPEEEREPEVSQGD